MPKKSKAKAAKVKKSNREPNQQALDDLARLDDRDRIADLTPPRVSAKMKRSMRSFKRSSKSLKESWRRVSTIFRYTSQHQFIWWFLFVTLIQQIPTFQLNQHDSSYIRCHMILSEIESYILLLKHTGKKHFTNKT